jgi:exopolyphosphatase/pppGpp-phosphohydrolase
MPAGLMIVVETMRKINAGQMLISRHGLRRGLILEAIA